MSEVWNKINVYTFEYPGEGEISEEFGHDLIALDIARSRPRRVNPAERAVLGLPNPITFESAMQALGDRYNALEIEGALSNLAHAGFLLPEGQPLPTKPKEPDFEDITTLELNMAEDCNLRCTYCCVGQGGFGADSLAQATPMVSLDSIGTNPSGTGESADSNDANHPRVRSRMSWDVARKAIDLLFKESGEAHKLHIRFFGGEPLMNEKVIRKAVEYSERLAESQGKKMGFSIVTNGTLLTREIIDFFKLHDFWVQISIDGTPEMHNAYRLDIDGGGSYESATALVPYLIETMGPDNLQVRGTLTHFDVDLVKAFDHLRGVGFEDPEMRPVTGHDPSYAMTVEDYKRYNAGLDVLAQRIMNAKGEDANRYLAVFHPYLELLTTRLPRRPPCAAARNMIGISVDGTIKPCTDMVGKEHAAIDLGSIFDGAVNRDNKQIFLDIVDVDNKPVCSRCWARYICGGACASVELSNEGGLEENAGLECIWIRHAIKVSLWLYIRMSEDRPDLFYELFGKSYSFDLGPLAAIFSMQGEEELA